MVEQRPFKALVDGSSPSQPTYTFIMTTENTTEAKVYQLSQELDDFKKRKKAFVKAYNEEIKRIQEEIEELLNPEDSIELP